jgi:hypothetical protein
MKILAKSAAIFGLAILAASASAEKCAQPAFSEYNTKLPLCKDTAPYKDKIGANGEIPPDAEFDASSAQPCKAVNKFGIQIAYPALDMKTGKATLKVASESKMETAGNSACDVRDGLKKFQSDQGTYANFPASVRNAATDIFDKNEVNYSPDSHTTLSKLIKPCTDTSATGGMDGAVFNICSNKTDKGTTYKVPSSVDCKTGKISYTETGDRGSVMTALNTYRVDSSVCSSAKLAPGINKDGQIAPHKIGALDGDSNNRTMKYAQIQLNKFLSEQAKRPADADLPDNFKDGDVDKKSLPADKKGVPMHLDEDGKRGDNTRRALLMFQADHKLPQSGILDDATLKALNFDYNNGNPTPKKYYGRVQSQVVVPPPAAADDYGGPH